MAATEAVKSALELLHVPSRVRSMAAAPLPDGVDVLLAIASGDRDSLSKASETTGRPEATILDAAKFFIEQILLAPSADSYRILGATPETSPTDLRRHMAMLSKWLHPDAGMNANRPAFTGRLNQAWDTIKTPERRAAYDAAHSVLLRTARPFKKKNRTSTKQTAARQTPQGVSSIGRRLAPAGRLRRALFALLGRDQQ
jgi:hypothetical protein